MNVKTTSKNAGVQGALAALKRAAKRAMRRAVESGTPLYVMENGKIVDMNKKRKRTS